MAEYFIPAGWPSYRAWLLNFKTEIATAGPLFGLVAADILALQNLCQGEIDKIDAYNAAVAAAPMALATARTGKKTTDKTLAPAIAGWKTKTDSGWTDTIAQQLHVVSVASDFDPDTYKPEFTVKIVGGEIRIDFKKKGVDGVRVYCRLRGTMGWTFLALDTSSPYIDGRPLAQSGVPEVREYMLRGVVNDEEIGLDSDILSITWAGN